MRPVTLKVGNTMYWVVKTFDPDDGITPINIDSSGVPTFLVRKNGAAVVDSVTATKRAATTGVYDCYYSPVGEAAGDQFTIEEFALIGAVNYPNDAWHFTVIEANTLVISSSAPELSTIGADGKLTIHRGDYTTFDLTLGDLSGRVGEKLVFTLKPVKGDLLDDTDCYLQITELSGAVLLNGTDDDLTASDASMTVIDENTGQTRFVIKGAITNLLVIGADFWYDVQMFDSAGEPRTKTEDRAEVTQDVTRRMS